MGVLLWGSPLSFQTLRFLSILSHSFLSIKSGMGAGGFEKGTLDVLIDNEFCIFAEEGSYTAEDGYIPEGVMQFTATVDEVTDDNCVIVKTILRPNDSHRSKKMSDTNSRS